MPDRHKIFDYIDANDVNAIRMHLQAHPDDIKVTTSYEHDKDLTPLIYAAKVEKSDPALCLLEFTPNLNAINNWGETALHYASSNGLEDVVQALVDKGADRKIQNNWKNTAVKNAASLEIKNIIDLVARFIKENEYTASYRERLESSESLQITYYNFRDETITRNIISNDGQNSSCMAFFNQTAGNRQIEDAAAFLKKNEGKIYNYRPQVIK